jgi:hypothetical protein
MPVADLAWVQAHRCWEAHGLGWAPTRYSSWPPTPGGSSAAAVRRPPRRSRGRAAVDHHGAAGHPPGLAGSCWRPPPGWARPRCGWLPRPLGRPRPAGRPARRLDRDRPGHPAGTRGGAAGRRQCVRDHGQRRPGRAAAGSAGAAGRGDGLGAGDPSTPRRGARGNERLRPGWPSCCWPTGSAS